jgi:hypothetical protein
MYCRCTFLYLGRRSLDGKEEGLRANPFSFYEDKIRRNRYD